MSSLSRSQIRTAPRRRPGLFEAVADCLAIWAERRRERRHLAGLSDHLIHDIGLSRSDVERETAKPFWRA
jgi:uncharacterized protein YjiS (DUF1127 family)